jgi:ABC-type uncharacterized transport system substrate-binding protein
LIGRLANLPSVVTYNALWAAVRHPLKTETQTIPIIFVVVADPIGAGFVASLPRPGGNITGFIFTEATMGGKRLELLTQIAPGVKRAANGGQAFSK